jgi:hypothetical protein
MYAQEKQRQSPSHLGVSGGRRHTTRIIDDSWKLEKQRAMDYLASASPQDLVAVEELAACSLAAPLKNWLLARSPRRGRTGCSLARPAVEELAAPSLAPPSKS